MGFRKFFMPDGRVSVSHVAHDARLDIHAPIVVNGEQYYIEHLNQHGSILLYEKKEESVQLSNKLEILLNAEGNPVSAKLDGDGFYQAINYGSCQVDPPIIAELFKALAQGTVDVSTSRQLKWADQFSYCQGHLFDKPAPCMFLRYDGEEDAYVLFEGEITPKLVSAEFLYTDEEIKDKTTKF